MMTITILLVPILSLISVYYTIPFTIFISKKKNLFDEPTDERKIHESRIPNLGGIPIFCSVTLASLFFLTPEVVQEFKFIIIGGLIIFMVGLTDDIIGVSPLRKVIVEIGLSLVVILGGGIKISSLYGLFGVHEIPPVVSLLLSTGFMVIVINGFNLIDGIDGLAGSISLLVCMVFASVFWLQRDYYLMGLALALCGALAGFLIYNWSPATIFMGDTGSLFIGFIVSVFSIKFMESDKTLINHLTTFKLPAAPVFIFSVLIIPLFDTIRVFTIRLMKGKSPFFADRNHLHHRLLELNITHLQSTGILFLLNLISIGISFLLSSFSMEIILLVLLLNMCVFTMGFARIAFYRKLISLRQSENKSVVIQHQHDPKLMNRKERSIATSPASV